MILDRLERLDLYFESNAARLAREFLLGPGRTAAPGEYLLSGRQVFAVAASYTTKPRRESILEAHRRYVDIQVVMEGREWLEWAPLEGLAVERKYAPDRDAGFYALPPETAIGARALLTPGLFALLLPRDAHAPGIAADVPSPVRKVVVKIEASLLLPGLASS